VSRPWEVDFVAVSAALGEPMTMVTAALGDAGTARAGGLVRALQSTTRSARATTLATALAAVAADLERLSPR
jgi:hypothetical protein